MEECLLGESACGVNMAEVTAGYPGLVEGLGVLSKESPAIHGWFGTSPFRIHARDALAVRARAECDREAAEGCRR
ncbi:hypothetical protein GCM10022403_007010 [Streptomyces coacervatus]|uniref:Uncharacterized protein n=1 Tax=Streptomyces coacervatus TaxID=647381 RepID=A0ABP7GU53_9ACTN